MRVPRILWLTASVVTTSALVGGMAASGSAQPRAAVRAALPLAAKVADTKCKDGANQVASFAPGSITANPTSITKSATLDRIRKSGRLTVGTSGDVLLWGATDPKTGELEGYDIDLLKEIAKRLNVQISYKVVNYGERLTSLQNDSVDLVAHTMTINCARWQGVSPAPNAINFSSEYYRAGQRLLVRKGSAIKRIEDLGGQSLCVPAASTNQALVEAKNKALIAANKAPVKVVAPAVIGDCLVKFQEGEVVAITGDDTVLAGFVAQDDYATMVGAKLSEEPYGLGIKQDDIQFTQFVNAVLQQLREDGTLRRLYDTWMAPTAAANEAAPEVPAAVYGRKPDRRQWK